MNKLWVILLLVTVAAAAFFLGRRTGESAAPATPPGLTEHPSAQAGKSDHNEHASEPVRTFRGPDGRAYIISYNESAPPDNNDAEQVRKALLSDMKFFPTNIQNSYDLSPADIKAILAGTKTMPAYMLPVPGGPPAVK